MSESEVSGSASLFNYFFIIFFMTGGVQGHVPLEFLAQYFYSNLPLKDFCILMKLIINEYRMKGAALVWTHQGLLEWVQGCLERNTPVGVVDRQ